MVHAVPGGREKMLINVRLGVPPEFPHVDLEEIARASAGLDPPGLRIPASFLPSFLAHIGRRLCSAGVFPYGRLLPVDVTVGGLTFGCGRVVPQLGDVDDTAIVAVAAVSLGYHDASDASDKPKTWDTRDGH